MNWQSRISPDGKANADAQQLMAVSEDLRGFYDTLAMAKRIQSGSLDGAAHPEDAIFVAIRDYIHGIIEPHSSVHTTRYTNEDTLLYDHIWDAMQRLCDEAYNRDPRAFLAQKFSDIRHDAIKMEVEGGVEGEVVPLEKEQYIANDISELAGQITERLTKKAMAVRTKIVNAHEGRG